MKFIICITFTFFLAINALTDEQKAASLLTFKECAEEIGVSFDELIKAKHGEEADLDVEKAHCVTKCFLEKNDLLIDGVLQESALIDRLSSNVDRSIVEGIAAGCHVEEIEDCEAAFKLFECYAPHKDELNF